MVFDDKTYSTCSLDHEGVKKSNASKRTGPMSDRCMKGTTYDGISESKFYIRLHDVFTLFFMYYHVR